MRSKRGHEGLTVSTRRSAMSDTESTPQSDQVELVFRFLPETVPRKHRIAYRPGKGRNTQSGMNRTGDPIMATHSHSRPLRGAAAIEIVLQRAGRLGATLSRADDGWTLDSLPYSIGQLGYPNLYFAEAPRRVRALSLREADHFLFLCEQRHRANQPRPRRPHVFLDR